MTSTSKVEKQTTEKVTEPKDTIDLAAIAKPLMDEWKAKLTSQTEKYVQFALSAAEDNVSEGDVVTSLEAIGEARLLPYHWWNVMMLGPFQFTQEDLGPSVTRRKRALQADTPAFMVCALWRNPAPIPGTPGLSAATILSMPGHSFRIRLETIDLTAVRGGPEFGPVQVVPGSNDPIDVFFVPIAFPAPVDGKAHLYEMNVVLDASEPYMAPPEGGLSIWLANPDVEPFFLRVPPARPELQHDNPVRFQVDASGDVARKQIELREIVLSFDGGEPFTSSAPRLTPSYLSTVISPYLEALADLQQIISSAQGGIPGEVTIKSIRQNSPVSVSLEGASQAIQVIRESVIPWRKKHAESMAVLLEKEKQEDIEIKRTEILEKHANMSRARAEAQRISAEAARQREEAERMRIENEKQRLELRRQEIQLALDIIQQVAPGLAETERVEYITRLLPPLQVLTSSEIILSTTQA